MLEFSERLKDLRIEKGLTAQRLGEILGVSHTTIARWESGAIVPSIEHLKNIALYFGVSSDYLIGIED